jgi:butyrate kinase
LVDDERWPRLPFGSLLSSLFQGEITHSELSEIIAGRSGVTVA